MDSIENLNRQLKKIQKEIQDYQKACTHKRQHIKFDGKNNARWYCKKCDKMLRIPTYNELQDWMKR